MDNAPKMDNAPFTVTRYEGGKYASGKPRPERWKLEIRKKFAGRKVRRFFDNEPDAWEEGERLTGMVREKGVAALQTHGKTVSGVIKEFWSVRGESIKGAHRVHMARVFRLFEERHGRAGMASLGPMDLHKFWNREEWPEGKSTRRQVYAYLRILFNWAERYEFIDRNPIRRVDPPRTPPPLTNILTPEELQRLLALTADSPEMRAYLCLGAFAGLRTDEIRRVRANHLDWKAKEIEIESGKTGARFVDMIPAFIRNCPKEWPAFSERTFRRHREHLVTLMGWDSWPDNCLRHTFATYLLAKLKDAPRVAHQMGHSDPKMVNKVYALPAKRAEWRKWWAL